MKCGKDCEYFAAFGNSDECGLGVCRKPAEFITIKLNEDCRFELKPYTCKDCYRFTRDFACLTCEENDEPCCGFLDLKYIELCDILAEWKKRGIDIDEKINEAKSMIE